MRVPRNAGDKPRKTRAGRCNSDAEDKEHEALLIIVRAIPTPDNARHLQTGKNLVSPASHSCFSPVRVFLTLFFGVEAEVVSVFDTRSNFGLSPHLGTHP